MKLESYFKKPLNSKQKAYEMLRSVFKDGASIKDVAKKAKTSPQYLRNLCTKARKSLTQGEDPFFSTISKREQKNIPVKEHIIKLRKRNLSIVDIKAELDSLGMSKSLDTIDSILKEEGFAPLPRRSRLEKTHLPSVGKLKVTKSAMLDLANIQESFSTIRGASALIFLPLIQKLGIIEAIDKTNFPRAF